MRRKHILLTLTAVVALAAAAAAAARQVQPTATASAMSTGLTVQEVDGKKLFERECASCHGKQGRGNGRAGRSFNPRPTDITALEYLDANDDARILEVIANGQGDMDGIAVDYDDEQMKAIVAYVRQLGEKRNN